MSDDEPKGSGHETLPPPPGEEDLYSACTVVGQASAELLALVRSAEEAATVATPRNSEKPPASEEAKLDAMKEVAALAAKEAAANEAARESLKRSAAPPPIASAGAAPAPAAIAPPRPAAPAPVAAPPPVAVPEAPPSGAPEKTVRRTAWSPPGEPPPARGLPPYVGIVALFVAVALALAAVVR